ncbi:hypothetical protein MSG37_19405 [Shewanella sp. 1CM18E]|uniref:hypothetical protein n=1 Tax=Shewanella sp. 1CM18E TaxID=2929169 RepID=UPI0020C0FC4B|nr:hypothetical protein [Shewanella sp. 1CM18E]MCK8047060.1 hypothetical protein [Shewanella sp. 1CM18E]
MKYSLTAILALSIIVALSGCSSTSTSTSTSTSKFAEIENETSNFCSKFNGINKMGKEIKVTQYTIKVEEIDDYDNKSEANKTVICAV